jgi:hypothetical protein
MAAVYFNLVNFNPVKGLIQSMAKTLDARRFFDFAKSGVNWPPDRLAFQG